MLAAPPHLGRILAGLAIFAAVVLTTNLFLVQNGNVLSHLSMPNVIKTKVGRPTADAEGGQTNLDHIPTTAELRNDGHPIQKLMTAADREFEAYDSQRSRTFAQAVKKYRAKYGRHPPPGFDKWYMFARERGIYNIDDFDQIWDDLRPYWSIPPKDLRKLVRGLQREEYSVSGVTGIRVRSGVVTTVSREGGEDKKDETWRAIEFGRMMNVIKDYLPDMDMVMNRLDQPRVIVPWKDLQESLAVEVNSRGLPKDVTNEFTARNLEEEEEEEEGDLPTGGWYNRPGKQYMDIASMGCSPESYTVNNATMSEALAERTYKLPNSGGIVTNFNLSSDLCTVGPQLAELHGLLFSAASITASHKLIPVFGECKVNVNNDILFPANMYYKNDDRYEYDPASDIPWADKQTKVFWRGITSGGVQNPETWRRLHRHRFVLMTNSTALSQHNETFTILTPPPHPKEIPFSPARFAEKYTDVGFPQIVWCVPDGENCSWLKPFFSTVSSTTLTEQFVYKYLIDIDGHSFSGRWHAFLKSRSLGLKATIFREWHDSRLRAWRHFVPVDNRFDDFYALMTYFIGEGDMRSHDKEAEKIAEQGREWAQKVLRKEDIEIYMLRLMLEYARLMDDRRDVIGYGGDGSEVVENPEWSAR